MSRLYEPTAFCFALLVDQELVDLYQTLPQAKTGAILHRDKNDESVEFRTVSDSRWSLGGYIEIIRKEIK